MRPEPEVGGEHNRGKEAGKDDRADGQRSHVPVDGRLGVTTQLVLGDEHHPVTEDHADHRNHVNRLEQHRVGEAR